MQEMQDESSDSSSSRSDASSWESGAPWAEEPFEEGEQELDPDLRAPIEPLPTEDEFRVTLGFCSLLGQCGMKKG